MRVSDYIADFLVKKGVTDCFMVVGGGAMYLNNSFGHKEGLKCTHFHHEQGAAIAAESYSRYEGKVAVLNVTSGPGGTNAITGVLGGWLDSLPMFVVSGQVRYDTTVRYWEKLQGIEPGATAGYGDSCVGHPMHTLRSLGDQEYDITKMTGNICKYAVMLEDPSDIRYHLEKAWHLMNTGRPGPVWIDVPVNFQAAEIDPESLRGFEAEGTDGCVSCSAGNGIVKDNEVSQNLGTAALEVFEEIKKAKRPVIYAGGGVRISDAFDVFRKVVDMLGVPVCTYWNSIDLIEDEHPLYCGRGGNMGDRAGNFAIQNSDLLLVIGSRLSIRQVGYNWSSWARAAKVIMVDIDPAEMDKHTLHVDKKICADAKDFLEKLEILCSDELSEGGTENCASYIFKGDDWRAQCVKWKEKYPVVSDSQRHTGKEPVNVYGFIRELSERLPAGELCAVSNGACCVAGHQSWKVKEGSRFIINNAVASMGYGLPAAIGLCIASGLKETICLEGDGSIMMNLQELQTIITNKLPVKIFLINNDGYHSIRLTQNNLFSEYSKVGIGPESEDLAFPTFRKIADAFGYPYIAIHTGDDLDGKLDEALRTTTPLFVEVFTDTTQVWAPKSSARREPDGTLTSPPLEDLAPFLPREELAENMYI
ncbi:MULTISPECIES: thiamine pyrophosphate-binding protein [unclassified Butyrivibrio]|uniref:thiamine pyrophosphate-binding protein n=1 Tax=unclassified Butyrivibrio TaxID=2639466 RepID=UPI0003B7A044|nr:MULTISPECIES: thiamine pyrophosphate-binding protein [unclassified Butyrivibrio]MDC7293614.1 thiamine pyrophosphate-binding protein [Butyrivibrio sp. DSM 10294]